MNAQTRQAIHETSPNEKEIAVPSQISANATAVPNVKVLPIHHENIPSPGSAPTTSLSSPEQGCPISQQEEAAKFEIPAQWLASRLKPLGLWSLIAGEISIILTVGVLYHFSRQKNGFVAVPDSPSSFWDGNWTVHDKLLWAYALLWTSIPAFIMGTYGSHWKSMVGELGKREPFVLKERSTSRDSSENSTRTMPKCKKQEKVIIEPRQLGVSGKGQVVSKPLPWNRRLFEPIRKLRGKWSSQLGNNPTSGNIIVDYSSYWPLQDAYEAFRNNHWVLGISMLISTVLSPALSSLSAAFLTTALVQSNSTIPLTANYFFNDSVMVSNTSLRPAFDIVAATQIYGGTPPPWTTERYAFLPFTPTSDSTSGNITARSTGYSASLNCVIIPPESYQVVTSAVTETAVEIQLGFDDRGCFTTPSLQVSPGIPTYVQSWANTTCSPYSGWSRIGLLAGQYSATSEINITSFSVISCIPTYYTTPGSLTMSMTPGSAPTFIALAPDMNATIENRPSIWRLLEDNLQYYTIFDPTDEFRMNDFSRVVYTYALLRNASAAFTAEALNSSMSDIFRAFYAAFVGTSIIAPASEAQAVVGTLSTMQNRLFVFDPIAFVIMGVVGLAFFCNVAVVVHVQGTSSVQDEDSGGILGNAVMIDGSSEMQDLIEKLKNTRDGETNLMDVARKKFDVSKARCWWEREKIRVYDGGEVDPKITKKQTWYSRVGHALADIICGLVCG